MLTERRDHDRGIVLAMESQHAFPRLPYVADRGLQGGPWPGTRRDQHMYFMCVLAVLSWIMQRKLPTVVVETEEQSRACYQLQAKAVALSKQVPYMRQQVGGGAKRPRTDEERARKQLPMPSMATVPGQPKWAINEFQFLVSGPLLFCPHGFWLLKCPPRLVGREFGRLSPCFLPRH